MKKLFWVKWSFLLKLRCFLGIVILLLITIFFYLKIVPGGEITYYQDYSQKKSIFSFLNGRGFIYSFSPIDRTDQNFKDGVSMIGDPLYFSIFTPRTFNKAKITIVYKNKLQIDTPIVEAGVLVDKLIWRYDLKPLGNKTLDYLSLAMDKQEKDGILFLQAEKNYDSFLDFQEDLNKGQIKGCARPLNECLSVYNYTPKYSYHLANYQQSLPVVLDKVLRGPHQFYVYLKDEKIHLEFDFLISPLAAQFSPIEVILSADNRVITSRSLSSDVLSPEKSQRLILEENNLPAGVYKVEIKASEDILIKRISSSLNRFVFINKIRLAENEEPITFYTDSNYLQTKALSPASRQTIRFAETPFSLDEAYRQFDFKTESTLPVKEIKINKGEIVLENNGVFSWQEGNLFNPSLKKIDRFFSVSEKTPYVIAEYTKPIEKEGVITATVELDIKHAYRENGKYSFMISVPGLKAEDRINDNLEIYSLEVKLSGRTLWEKIKSWKP